MSTTKLLDVTDDAKAILGSIFRNKGLTLTYQLFEGQPSARLWAALCELLNAKAIVCKREAKGFGPSLHYAIEFTCCIDTQPYWKFANKGKGILMNVPVQ